MISFREGGENGGPYVSHRKIMTSVLNEKYDFVPLIVPKGRLGLLNMKVIKKLTQDIKRENPDIVHFAGLQLEGFHVAVACKLVNMKKNIVAVHGSSSESLELTKFKKIILHILESLTLRWAYNSYGVSEYVSSWDLISKNTKRHQGCIYNLADLEKDLEMDNKVSLREELRIPKDNLVIVSTGRIVAEKGYEVLTKAIKQMSKEDNIHFVIAGDGNYLPIMKEELSEQIKQQQVFLLGYRNDISNILNGSDIFVICTLHETLCISLLEASIAGLPSVATNVGGIPEIITHNETGILTEPKNVDEVVNALKSLKNNKKKRLDFGVNARRKIENKFSNQKILNQIDQLYKETFENE